RWLLLHARPVVAGYKVNSATVALQIVPSYPEAQIDMAYFRPHLERIDGKAIPALATHDLEGVSFQRWSRHRTNEAPWGTGEGDVAAHLALVDDWLERELLRP